MSEDEINELASVRLDKPTADLDPSMASTVYSQCQGNPLLACEIIDMLYSMDAGGNSGSIFERG